MSVKIKLLFAVCCVALCFTGNVYAANLIAHWGMDGNATDSSVNGYDATAEGSPTYVAGPIGLAVSLNGTTDYFRVIGTGTDTSLDTAMQDGYTIAAWIKAPLSGSFRTILGRGIGTSEGWAFHQYSSSNRIDNYTLGDSINDGADPFDDVWHHVVVIADYGFKDMYVDGVYVESGTYDTDLWLNPNSRDLWIGNNSASTSRWWNGELDEVCIFDDALTPTEISDLMTKGVRALVNGDYLATNPSPANGAGVDASISSLSWTLPEPRNMGDTVTCDVLISENPDMSSAQLLVNKQAVEIVGVSLAVDKTYYWRVDSYDPDSPGPEVKTEGHVWTFTTLALKATVPDPEDNGTAVDAFDILAWAPGTGAESHRVYLSTNEQEVTEGTVAYVTTTDPDYNPPGSLEFGTTYYWRVDEVSNGGSTVIEGDVWSFTTDNTSFLDDFPNDYADLAELQAVWGSSVQQSPSNWLALYHSTSQQTFSRTFDDKGSGSIDLSKAIRLSLGYNYNSATCGTEMPTLTIRLLDASETVQFSGAVDTTDELPGSFFIDYLDLSSAGDLSAITKIELVLDAYPGGCSEFVAIQYLAVGGPVCIAADSPELDMDNDCVVNLGDLAIVFGDWLECTLANQLNCP